MVEQIIIQGAVAPAAISSAYLLYVSYKKNQNNINITFYSLLWLLVYAWVVDIPGVPPVKAVDWLLPLVAVSIAAHLIFNKYRQKITVVIFHTITMLMVLPLLNQLGPVVFTTVVDIVVLLCVQLFVYILAINHKIKNSNVDLLSYSLLLNFSSILVAVKGSLLIGLLLMAQCVMVFILWLYSYRHKINVTHEQLSIFCYLTLSLIFISRVYVEVDMWLYIVTLSVFGALFLGKTIVARIATIALFPILLMVIYHELMTGPSGPY